MAFEDFTQTTREYVVHNNNGSPDNYPAYMYLGGQGNVGYSDYPNTNFCLILSYQTALVNSCP
ncbi:MAG TPA: hypothetical protein VNA15_01700 [Candidatus Angelobacter sp.]|nr:hypothetical protein [Candidatus Angelobacter sp.]